MARRPRLLTELGIGRSYDPWQRHYMANRAKFIRKKKSRRTGGSFIAMDKAFVKSQRKPGYRCQAVSIRQEDAKGLIEYVDEAHDDLPPRFRLRRITDSKTEIAFEFPNGKRSVITAYPNKAPRSRGGDVILDEFAFGRDDRKVFNGALPVVSLSPDDQMTVLSTPFAKSGVFYDLDRCADGKYRDWDSYLIPWWICRRLCTDTERAAVEAPLMPTQVRVEAFGTESLQAIFNSFPDLEAFQVEYELKFMEALSALFSPELMDRITVAEWGDMPGDALACRVVETLPTDFDWMWLKANRKGILYGGFDVGRQRNESDFVIWDIDGSRKDTRMIIRLYQQPYRDQKAVLVGGLKQCDILRTCIDATGIGNELAEDLSVAYPQRFQGVMFTPQVKDQLATRMYIAATAKEREVFMPRYRPLVLHFISIRKEAGSGGQVRYSVNLNEQQEVMHHHADIFWAACLGLEAANIPIVRGGIVLLGNRMPK